MLKYMREPIVKVVDGRSVLVEERYVVLSGGRPRAVDRREFVLRHVCICDAHVSVTDEHNSTRKTAYHYPSNPVDSDHA